MEAIHNMVKEASYGIDAGSGAHPLGLPGRVLMPLPYLGQGIAGGAELTDPKYGLRFARLSDEVQKLGNTDFALISQLSVELLEEEGKDLRVLGFLCLGELHQRGLAGFAAGLAAVRGVVEGFADSLYPQREQGRYRALEWLANKRVVAFLKGACVDCSASELEHAIAALAELETALACHFADPPALRQLRECMEQHLQSSCAAPGRELQIAEELAAYSTLATASTAASASSNLLSKDGEEGCCSSHPTRIKTTSERDMSRQLRSVIDYLRSEDDLLRMVALSRSWKWAGLQALAVNGGRVAIEPPRSQALGVIKNNIRQGFWQEALIACENVFLEPGGHLYLDVQVWAEQAAEELGLKYVAQRIRMEAHGLILRIPELPELSFVDGQPLLSPENIDWIKRLPGLDCEKSENLYKKESKIHRKSFIEHLGDAKRSLSLGGVSSSHEANYGVLERGIEANKSACIGLVSSPNDKQAKVSVEFIVELQ